MRTRILVTPLFLGAALAAQLPQGYFAFGTFGGAATLQKGLFFSHPRDPGAPLAVSGLRGDLVVTGSSCILYRAADRALLVGERAPVGGSVDLHVILLDGLDVRLDASFSVGTGGSCCGEIPQMALLPDGRVLVAATDVDAGPLRNYLTTSYGWQGLGTVDTQSGLVESIPITNGAAIVDVFNGLALAPDAGSVYLGTYVSATQGDIWQVPLPAGGTATLVATVPAGLSNMAFDNDGQLWVTTLDQNQGLFRVDVSTGTVTQVPQTNGALNAIANESVTGNLAVVSASRGVPARSIFWMERNGTEHLLSTPGFATPSGIVVHANPAAYGAASGAISDWNWQLAPNPGGLPQVGDANFSLRLETAAANPPPLTLSLVSLAALASPVAVIGIDVWVDLGALIASFTQGGGPQIDIPLPIPNDPSLVGGALFVQVLGQQSGGAISASPAVALTIL